MNALTQADATNYLPVRPDWLARRTEAILEPDLPIIDPHHHLWDRSGWRYMAEDLVADVSAGHRIIATVFVQCQAMYRARGPAAMRVVGETEFVNGVAAMGASGHYGPAQLCAGIVGHADLRLGAAVRDVLEAHIRAGNGRFRGIRHTAAWDADAALLNPRSAASPGLLGDTTFREGFATLAPLGLSYEAWLFHPQLDELRALADAFPETRIVLNHCGGPLGIGAYAQDKAAVFTAWSAAIRRLSECANVWVKLGGLGMRIGGFGFEQPPDPPHSATLAEAWRPFIETCIDAFGPDRCMFESNFPVDKGSYSYVACWNAFKRLTAGASVEAKAALFSETARSVYRLDLP